MYLLVPAFLKQTVFRNNSRPTNTLLRRAVLWLRWLVTSLTVEVRPRSQDSSCGVCDGQSVTGTGSESTSVSPVIIIAPVIQNYLVTYAMYCVQFIAVLK